jgi:hypothetical protein
MIEAHVETLSREEPATRERERAPTDRLPAWATPAIVVAATGLFALVVNLVHLGFARQWADPIGYVGAILKPIILTLPGYLVLRLVLGGAKLDQELVGISRALRRASLSIACYAPVIWFCLVTSPTPTFPILAFSFGAIAFWVPLVYDVARNIVRSRGGLVTALWLIAMSFTEARELVVWLASNLGRVS